MGNLTSGFFPATHIINLYEKKDGGNERLLCFQSSLTLKWTALPRQRKCTHSIIPRVGIIVDVFDSPCLGEQFPFEYQLFHSTVGNWDWMIEQPIVKASVFHIHSDRLGEFLLMYLPSPAWPINNWIAERAYIGLVNVQQVETDCTIHICACFLYERTYGPHTLLINPILSSSWFIV